MSASLITRAALLAGTAMLLTGCLSSDKSSPAATPIIPMFGPTLDAAAGGDPITSPEGRVLTVSLDEGQPDWPPSRRPGTLALGFNEDLAVDSVAVTDGETTLFHVDTNAPLPGDDSYDDFGLGFTNPEHQDAARKIELEDDYLIVARLNAHGSVEDIARIADPREFGFEYQSYGVWVTGMGHFKDRSSAGAGTFGQITAARTATNNAIATPIRGSAIYSGGAAGIYAMANGDTIATTANFDATANFASSSVSYELSETTGVGLGGSDVPENLSHLDRTGTAAISDNAFAGTFDGVSTSTVEGNFYGNRAAEVGGTFSMNGDEIGGVYMGSFGGRQ